MTITTTPASGTAAADPEVECFLELIERDRPDAAIDLALDRIRDGETVTSIVELLLAPAQRLAGERWHRGRYTVADEHVASGVVDDLLGLLTAHTPRPNPEHTVALVCAEGEWHTTPARMAALCLRDAGWRVQFLGGSLPPEHLTASLRNAAPRAVAISCTLPLALTGVPGMIDVCRHHELPTITGGVAFGPDDRRSRHLGADGHARDIATAATLLTEWLDRPPTAPIVAFDPAVNHERATLMIERADLVAATYRHLEQQLPMMADYDERQRRHTREDLDYILRFIDTTLLVDDHRVFADFTTWLRDLLEARGVPEAALFAALDAVDRTLPADLTRSRAVLEHGRATLRAGTPSSERDAIQMQRSAHGAGGQHADAR